MLQGATTLKKEYLELTRLIERLHRRFLDLLRAELNRLGIRDINSVQALLLANIGREEIAIRDLAQMIAAEVGFEGDIIWDTSQPNGQPRRCLDVNRAKSLFGFEAAHRMRDGLPKTIAWFHEHRHW